MGAALITYLTTDQQVLGILGLGPRPLKRLRLCGGDMADVKDQTGG